MVEIEAMYVHITFNGVVVEADNLTGFPYMSGPSTKSVLVLEVTKEHVTPREVGLYVYRVAKLFDALKQPVERLLGRGFDFAHPPGSHYGSLDS